MPARQIAAAALTLAALVLVALAPPVQAADVSSGQLRNCTVLSRLFRGNPRFAESAEVQAFRDGLQTQLLSRYPAEQRDDPDVVVEIAFVAANVETDATLGYPALYFQDATRNGKAYEAALADLRATRRGMETAGLPGGLIGLYRDCVRQMMLLTDDKPAWARLNQAGQFEWPAAFDPLEWE